LIEQARGGRITIVSSAVLLAEFAAVVRRRKFRAVLDRSSTDPEKLLLELRRLAEIIDPSPAFEPVSRDPGDDAVLAVAIATAADLIVSGDRDLLTLRSHGGIPIVDAAGALVRIW